MAKAFIQESTLTDIANAIRGKNSSSDTYLPSEMAAAITAIPTGGGGEWEPNWFYIEDVSGAANTLTIKKSNNALDDKVFEWSLDKQTWTTVTITDTTGESIAVPANGKVYLRGDNITLANANYYTNIDCTSVFAVGGDITTLLVKAGSQMMIRGYAYSYLFFDSNVQSAQYLDILVTSNHCCESMFHGCTSLTHTPALPATALSQYCYQYMFQGCTSLTAAPALPANETQYACYRGMFKDCTSLATTPSLPATTMTTDCYREMFQGCTSLTAAPALPATTILAGCYRDMFHDCTLLTRVEVYATAWIVQATWLSGVAATGDFYNLRGATIPTGTNGIPSGWTEHTTL